MQIICKKIEIYIGYLIYYNNNKIYYSMTKKDLYICAKWKTDISNDFLCLWNTIASKFFFIRLSYDINDTKQSDSDIITKAKENNKNFTYFNDNNDYKIIWKKTIGNTNEYILINKSWIHSTIFG